MDVGQRQFGAAFRDIHHITIVAPEVILEGDPRRMMMASSWRLSAIGHGEQHSIGQFSTVTLTMSFRAHIENGCANLLLV
jgi:hypothetical protein